jgi:hypothetical protein
VRSSWKNSAPGAILLPLLVVGLGLPAAWLVFVPGPGRTAPVPAEKEAKPAVERLTIELRLEKDQYSVGESVRAEVVLRNKGKDNLKVPLIDGADALLFFDFLIIGDQGQGYLTRNGGGWNDPSEKQVKLVHLRPGETWKVKLEGILSLRAFDAGVHEKEKYLVQAIYRDCTYGHSATYPEYGKDDPAVWKGIAISAPVRITRITLAADKK